MLGIQHLENSDLKINDEITKSPTMIKNGVNLKELDYCIENLVLSFSSYETTHYGKRVGNLFIYD
jgi:hypothetical protein